jgi:hypothetical protein
MRILLQHQSRDDYPSPASLGPHLIQLRPADHAKATIEIYSLTIGGDPLLNWHWDPAGNHVARLGFKRGQRLDSLDILVELGVEVNPVNPFDFHNEEYAQELGFSSPADLARALAPYLDTTDPA